MATTIVAQAYDAKVEDNLMNNERANILLWCLDRDSQPILLRTTSFPATCYIELPRFVNGKPFNWDQARSTRVVQYLVHVLKDRECAPVMFSFVKKHHLYYHRRGVPFPMLRLSFASIKAMKGCVDLIKTQRNIPEIGIVKMEVWENNVSMIRKFFTACNCGFTQWFQVEATEVSDEERISVPGIPGRPIREYTFDWRKFQGLDENETASWRTHPVTLSFDIETYSPHHRAMPDPWSITHQVYMISCICEQDGKPETRKEYGLVIGEVNEIPGTELISCRNEVDLILKFCDLITRLQPEVITGYNISGYDFDYLHIRLQSEGLQWPASLSRIPYLGASMNVTSWKSDAFGENKIYSLGASGLICIDLLPLVKRDYKFNTYTLNFVANNFLQRTKHDIKAGEMFQIYEQMQHAIKHPEQPDLMVEARKEMTRVMAYCVQDARLVTDLFSKLVVWVGSVELANVMGVVVPDLYTRGQQIRCFSQVYHAATSRNIVINSRISPEFYISGGHVQEPVRGVHDNVLCFDFASLYPSIIRAYNICYTTLCAPEIADQIDDADPDYNVLPFTQEEPRVIPKRHSNDDDEEDDPELDTDPSQVVKDITEKDTDIVTRHYKFKWYKKEQGLLPGIVASLVNKRNEVRGKMGKLKKDVKALDPRSAEAMGIQITLQILDKRQNALKVSANSIFGFLGALSGLLPLGEGCMTITAMGRYLIGEVNEYLKRKYLATIVYNDTDSAMIKAPSINNLNAVEMGNRISEEISGTPAKTLEDGTIIPAKPGLFPPPLRMEFEKAMRMLCVSKKRYAYFSLLPDGTFAKDPVTGDEYITDKGLITARRDTCKLAQKTFTRAMRAIMRGGTYEQIYEIYLRTCIDLLAGKVDVAKDLTITRKLGSNYKSNSYFMAGFAEELKRVGRPARPGDRLEYVVVRTAQEAQIQEYKLELAAYTAQNKVKLTADVRAERRAEKEIMKEESKLCKKMRLLEMYFESQEGATDGDEPPIYPKESIDHLYYLNHLLTNPLDQLFEVAFYDKFDLIRNQSYKPVNSKKRAVSLIEPVHMITTMVEDQEQGGRPLAEIVEALEDALDPTPIEAQ